MKKIFKIFLILLLFSFSNKSKSKNIEKDKSAILQMCGCYEVTFNYTETFVFSEDSNYTPSPNMKETIYEWVDLVEDRNNKIVLQHILQTSSDTDAFVIKHWRQDWQFEDTNLYTYDVNNKWIYSSLDKNDVEGKWSQKVYQIDDMPRYSGIGTWIHLDGISYWESTANAPLARRETKIRSDYNILRRRNRVQITNYGWLHEQDNKKIYRLDLIENIIAMEKGYNTYKRVDNDKCKLAVDWWEINFEKWKYVRDAWNKRLDLNKDLSINLDNNSISLYKKLSNLKMDSIHPLIIDKIIREYY
tara:strand:- start:3089 stop:3994 length:906 start_codon:yes stop_codon:yes gene_type:complete